MTKGSQLSLGVKSEKGEDPNLVDFLSSHPRSDPALNNVADKTNLKKTKRKTAARIPKTSVTGVGKKKKQNNSNSNRKTNCSGSEVQQKLSTNLAGLAPLLNRPCPGSLFQIENSKTENQEDGCNKENTTGNFHFKALDAPAPRPQRFQGNTSRRLQIFDKQRKKKTNLTNAVTTTKVAQSTPPDSALLERNYSSPSLMVSTICEKNSKRFDSSLLSCSQSHSSEFPDVVQFYQNDLIRGNVGGKIPLPLRNRSFVITHPKPSLLALQRSRGSFAPYPKSSFSSTSSHSAPNTPPTLLNARKDRLHLSLGAVPSWNFLRGLTGTDLANISLGIGENVIPLSESSSVPAQAEFKPKSHSSDTLNLISSIKKAMNSKSNQQITANQKNGQPLLQYHTGRARPRVGSNFSSSFILPYGLGNRVQSSPVSTPAVPSSSSFHGGPLDSLQLMSENHQRAVRQQSQCSSGQQQRKYLERQKMKMLKPLGVNKNQGNIAKLYDISTSEFSAAILPDPGTTSYRLTHDVSFDEGSRYRTADFPHGFKGKDDQRNHPININGLTHHFGSVVSTRDMGPANQMRHEGRITVAKDHMTNNSNNISFKETVPLSLIRMDERFSSDLPPATSPSSPAMSPAIAASASTSSFIPPPSASRQNPPGTTTTAAGNITFRLHKEKHNWNYRLGELAINGGGYYNPTAVNANSRQELDAINPMNMNSATQRNVNTRERISIAPKSRLSSRYSSKAEGAVPSFSDPCISSPPSFQQRLTDLSILESETLKYERNRKLRRKKNQDKDC